MAPGATVTALFPRTDHIDVFATRTDGTVRTTWWETAAGWHSWFGIKTASKVQGGALVAGVAPSATHIDLYATRTDGTVRTSAWQP